MKIRNISLIIAVALSVSASAMPAIVSTPETPFRLYTIEDGLNQKTVLNIAQDQDGFIWVATFGGINRFDGRSFDSLTTREGLRRNLIQALAVDSQNRLWAGDVAGGLTLLERGHVTRTFDPRDDTRGVVRTIVEVGDTLYIGSQPGGLRTLSLTNLDAGFSSIPGAPNETLALVPRSANEMLLLSADALYSFRPGPEPAFELIEEGVTGLRTDDSGRIAVGGVDGRIGWVDGDDVTWLDGEYGGPIIHLVLDDGALTWVFIEGKGMMPFGDPNADIVLPTGGAAPPMRDREGVLWVPARNGLARYLGDRFKQFGLEYDGVKPEVFSIAPGPNEDYWFGTNIGVLHLDRDGKLSNVSDQLGYARHEVREIKLSRDQQTVWIAQNQGPIYGIDLNSLTTKTAIGDEGTLTVGLELDRDGKLWSGSYLGKLSVDDPATNVNQTYSLGNGAAIYSLDLADDDYLWFSANYQGLFRINTLDPNAQPELMMSQQSIGHDFFTHVVTEGGGADITVWLTSVQGGVFRFRNGEIEKVINNSILLDQLIYAVQPLPDGTLVLVSSRGVYRYDLTTEGLEHYGALDGFIAIEGKVHATYYDGGDRLLIGTTSGLARMNLSEPMTEVGIPKVMITHRSVDGYDIDIGGGAPPDTVFGKVRIQFAAVSTRKPNGIKYSYRLIGKNDEWSESAEPKTIRYQNITPGDYKFEVRARLAGGEWTKPVVWEFTAPTPFWRTNWFIAFAVAVGLALTGSLIQLRIRATERVNRRLRKEVAERTKSIEAGRRQLEQTNRQLSSEVQERRKADALRAEVEARFHNVYQNSPIGTALVDGNGLVYDANSKMRELFWPDAASGDRQPLIDVVAASDRQQFSTFIGACTEGLSVEGSMEVNCISHSGSVRRINFHPAAIRDSEGVLQYLVLLANDVTESRAMTDQLKYQASFDELTGLVNRRAFSARLEAIGAQSNAVEEAYLMFLDLDQFKVVNDTCGHAAGDELLRVVAQVLSSCVREQDTVARLGGDEFALIVVNCTQETALQRAEQVRQRIQDLEFLWNQEVFRIGISIGVVPMKQANRDLDELQQVADAACYAAKEAGRNRVHLVAGKEDAVHEHRGEMRWVQRLNHAIDTDSFVLFGQRILPLDDQAGTSERIEVLLRMKDRKSNRLIPPGAFLPAAERYGLQGRLDLWVVNRVIETLSAQKPGRIDSQQVWVNLSGASVGDPNISQELIRIAEQASLPRGCLNFEITETAVIRKIDEASALIKALQAMGCRFALDDFGSGLSSFGYLKRLNVDCLKIDGQFVRDIVTDPTDRIFVKSIIDIAHTLGMRVVAEFVEDEQILTMVRSLGSDFAQGFGVHRPEPLEDIVALTQIAVEAGSEQCLG